MAAIPRPSAPPVPDPSDPGAATLPVYEVEEEPIERRIRSVPFPNDRRSEGDAEAEPGEGQKGAGANTL